METGGETLTAVSQLLTDTAIMGENSRFERLVDHYMGEELLTGEEARGRAFLDTLKEVVLAGFGGFLSGSVSGGSKAGLDSWVRTRSQKAQADATQAEIDLVDFLQGKYNERTITPLEDGELSGRGSGQEDSLDEGPHSFAPREIDTEVSIEGNLKVIEVRTPETANNEWLLKGYDKPPYHPDFEVKVAQAGEEEFVRVFSYNPDGTSNKFGGWIMRKSDIEGLTPAQIADRYALPQEPTHVCDVKVGPETVLQVGIANSVDGWGNGGGQQYDTMGYRLPRSAFVNERQIGG